jgi:hypothetical protein
MQILNKKLKECIIMQMKKVAKAFLVVGMVTGVLVAGGGGKDTWHTLRQHASTGAPTISSPASINEAYAASICSASMLAEECYNLCSDVCRAKSPTDNDNKEICMRACRRGEESGRLSYYAGFLPRAFANACADVCRGAYPSGGENKEYCMDACKKAKAAGEQLVAPCAEILSK